MQLPTSPRLITFFVDGGGFEEISSAEPSLQSFFFRLAYFSRQEAILTRHVFAKLVPHLRRKCYNVDNTRKRDLF